MEEGAHREWCLENHRSPEWHMVGTGRGHIVMHFSKASVCFQWGRKGKGEECYWSSRVWSSEIHSKFPSNSAMSERVMQQKDHVGRLVRTLPTRFCKKCCGPNCVFLAKYKVPLCIWRWSSWPRDWNCRSSISCIGKWVLYHWATWEALLESN